MKRIFFSLLLAITLIAPTKLFAWGRTGHTLVAEIALHFLDDSIKQNIQKYLGSVSLEDASVWMDEMRSDHTYDFMKPWHYINIEIGESYHPTNEINIVTVLIKTIAELDHKETLSVDQVKTNLMIICHLVGDLHQPLHVGYGIDKGGNKTQVSFLNHGTNLHKVWDNELVEDISLNDCLKLYDNFTKEQIQDIKKVDVVTWMNESRSLLNQVYNFRNNSIDDLYYKNSKLLAKKQLLFAGLRLASVIETLFKEVPKTVIASAIIQSNKPPITINVEDASKHIGEMITVCGKVYGGKFLDHSNGAPTLINMGAAYPNNTFTFVIFGSDREKFSYLPEIFLVDKEICVTGLMKEYKGKPEIIVSRKEQIEVR